MKPQQNSRRRFLQISLLLPASLLLSPAMAILPIEQDAITPEIASSPSIRADIRNLDFDSHNFMWNFKH